MRERHKDAFGLFADDIDLLDPRHMQNLLAQRFRIAHQQSLWLPFGLQRKERKGHVGEFIIDHRPDDACRQVFGLIPQLLTCLIKLFLHL